MKRIVGVIFGALLISLGAVPAMAQIQLTIPGFRSDNPWFNNVPQAETFKQFLANHPDDARELSRNPGLLYDPDWRGQHRQLHYFLQTHPEVWDGLKAQSVGIYDSRFNQFLYRHRDIASDLRGNPELIYNRGYRNDHPELVQFLADHPQVWENTNAQRETAGRTPGGLGAYDNHRQWHTAEWWHQNNPSWFWENHADWASANSPWRNQDGAYDRQHVWHYGQWWAQRYPDWVASQHPEWLNAHPNWRNQPAERLGAYDNQHRWHNANWWHQSNPDWFWENHPEWASVNPRWRDQDGTYDRQHVWHYEGSQSATRDQVNQQNQQALDDQRRQHEIDDQQRQQALDDQQHQQSLDDQQQLRAQSRYGQGRGDNNE